MYLKSESTEQKVEASEGKLTSCPLCDSIEDEGFPECFHCSDCGYLQCCDYEGFYDE